MDIPKNLRHIMEKQQLSINALERKSGVKPGSVQNILYGRSKNPGIETLLALAKALNISLNTLVYSSEDDVDFSLPWNADLYTEAVITVRNELHRLSFFLKRKEFLECVYKIYEYSQKSQKDKIDLTFATWLIEEKKAR